MHVEIRPYKDAFRVYLDGIPLSRKQVPLERASQQRVALQRGGKEEEIRNYSLSAGDIHSIIPTLRIITYPELLEETSIHDALDEKGRLLILYLTESETSGHWVCLLKRKRSNGQEYIEYFDPYGKLKPDAERKWLEPEQLRRFKQDTCYLTKLLKDSGLPVVYSKVPFQVTSPNVNTCGRHCVMRLYCKHLSLPQYTRMVQLSNMAPDDFVSSFTYALMGK